MNSFFENDCQILQDPKNIIEVGNYLEVDTW